MGTEQLRRRTPLGPLAEELTTSCASERFSCREDAFRTLTELRCRPADLSSVAAVVGLTLPGVGEVVRSGDTSLVGLGPQWWLLDRPDGSPPVDGSVGVMAVDVSAQRTPLVLTGTSVRDVLSHGTSLDVHRDSFGVGAAAQTLLAKAGVIVARTDPDEYRVWVRASFARYLAAWIIDASLEYR
jgi:sarcosine oxidase subunit gamma